MVEGPEGAAPNPWNTGAPTGPSAPPPDVPRFEAPSPWVAPSAPLSHEELASLPPPLVPPAPAPAAPGWGTVASGFVDEVGDPTRRGRGWGIAALVLLAAGVLGAVGFGGLVIATTDESDDGEAWGALAALLLAFLWGVAMVALAFLATLVGHLLAWRSSGRWPVPLIVAMVLTYPPAALIGAVIVADLVRSAT